ncbi:MFS transporter [Armatimonas rosea]|uniref:Sugar phosphate permease n=1 Tax=Armatimonas rosea TaxID=685828 RepID=A0A7W9W9F6_ARMRO|nr:MFS transporter [Armatimonas rosea]MBB6052562.1 sugar phosphate permease [Armatimonas rosea]
MEHPAVRKAALRLIPFLFFLYVIAYIDRVNVSFAKLEMKDVSWFSEAIFASGAGIFFFGYFLFEVPSNLILRKVGARMWITRIMITWGLISALMALSSSAVTFYFFRFMLGVAEAGFFPGVLLYLTFWFTRKERARVIALFMTANAVALTFGGPLSGWILDKAKALPAMQPWQWLFVLEGVPAMLIGFVVLAYLPNGPKDAKWLTQEEREVIEERLRVEELEFGKPVSVADSHDNAVLLKLVKDSRVWMWCGVYFLLVFGMYGITMWLPQLLKTMSGGDNTRVGQLTAIPYFTAGVAMVVNAWHSDKTNERRWHIAVPAVIGSVGLALSGQAFMPLWGSLVCLSVAAAGMWSTLGPFWAVPPQFLRGVYVAAGLAMINSVGNLAGFAGPKLFGQVKAGSDSFLSSLLLLAGFVLAGGLFAGVVVPLLARRSAETEDQ